MRKVIFLVILSLLVLLFVLAVPAVDGYLFKKNYSDMLVGLSRYQQANIKLIEYKQGWFNSSAKILIEPIKQPAPPFKLAITLEQHIKHGPLVRDPVTNGWTFAQGTVSSSLFLPDPITTMLFGNARQGIIQTTTLAKFNGDFINRILIPVINFDMPGQLKLTWQGVQGTTLVHADGRVITRSEADLTIGALTVESAMGSLVTQNIIVKGNLVRDKVGLWSGSYQVDMPGFTLAMPDVPPLSMQKLSLSNNVSLKGSALYTNDFELGLGQLVLPNITINSANTKISIIDINAPNLVKLLNMFTQIDPDNEADANKLLPYIPPLFTSTTRATENISFSTPEGRLLSDGQASWSMPINTIDDITKNAIIKINLRATIALVNKLIEVTTPKRDYEAPVTPQTPAEISQAELQKQLDEWVNQEKITVSTSIRIKDLASMKIPTEEFAAGIDQLVVIKVIPEELATPLKTSYANIVANRQSTVVPTAPASSLPPVEENKMQLNKMIQEGYIVVDKDDYVTTIVMEKGVLTVNGKTVTEPTVPVAQPVPSAPSVQPVPPAPATTTP